MLRTCIIVTAILFLPLMAAGQNCIECHKEITPGIVSDWQISKHSENDVSCATCHGEGHTTAADVANVEIPTPATCATCHDTQVEQFSKGKHALA